MSIKHKVKQGECFSSVAKKYGFLEKTLWNHSSNGDLKNKRLNPNVLLPGDVVTIPDRESGEETAPTDQKHVYELRGEKIKLQLRLLLNGVSRAGIAYQITADGKSIEGSTDRDGWIRTEIPASITTARLKLIKSGEEYELGLGHLDPVDEISGVQGRLANLGYYGDTINGKFDETTEESLRAFQNRQGIEESGTSDEQTQAALKRTHGC